MCAFFSYICRKDKFNLRWEWDLKKGKEREKKWISRRWRYYYDTNLEDWKKHDHQITSIKRQSNAKMNKRIQCDMNMREKERERARDEARAKQKAERHKRAILKNQKLINVSPNGQGCYLVLWLVVGETNEWVSVSDTGWIKVKNIKSKRHRSFHVSSAGYFQQFLFVVDAGFFLIFCYSFFLSICYGCIRVSKHIYKDLYIHIYKCLSKSTLSLMAFRQQQRIFICFIFFLVLFLSVFVSSLFHCWCYFVVFFFALFYFYFFFIRAIICARVRFCCCLFLFSITNAFLLRIYSPFKNIVKKQLLFHCVPFANSFATVQEW